MAETKTTTTAAATTAAPVKKSLPYWLDPKFYMANFIAIGAALYVGYLIGKKSK